MAHCNQQKLIFPVAVAAILLQSALLFSMASAASDSTTISQSVSEGGAVCGNGSCESGESSTNCSVDCAASTPTPGQFVDIFAPRITDILVQSNYNSAEISWNTSEPALSQFFWGETSELEREAVTGDGFKTRHIILISGLSPVTSYHFSITAKDRRGNFSETGDRIFTTPAAPDIIPPANVRNFEAVSGDGQINLSWQNPLDGDFAAVKILRSAFFYPQDPFEGETVYNARGEFFLDTGLQNGVKYYYAAFAYDKSGNYSSGAVAFGVPGAILPPPEMIPPVVPPPAEVKELSLSDFDFWQRGKKLEFENGRLVRVEMGEPLTVSIDYEKVPEVLKTIMITLEKPEGPGGEALPTIEGVNFSEAQASLEEALSRKRLFSFLLRINPGKTRYEAVIMPPDEELLYPLFATVMDFKHQALKRLEGEMATIKPVVPLEPSRRPKSQLWDFLFYILVVAALIWFLSKKRRKKKASKPIEQKKLEQVKPVKYNE